MDKLEKLIISIMKEAEEDGEPVTREEAEEMAKMEIGAKEINNYVPTEKSKKPREKKKDNDKLVIMETLINAFSSMENFSVVKEEKEIAFTLNGAEYSISLIKHRKAK